MVVTVFLESLKTSLQESRVKSQIRVKDSNEIRKQKNEVALKTTALEILVKETEKFLQEQPKVRQKKANLLKIFQTRLEEIYDQKQYAIAKGGTGESIQKLAITFENLLKELFPDHHWTF